ncbi:hypothetical protein GE21DRAFT_1090681 [Neurospora crassa]|nr:hypothetical protein GE21DRAFT_1090681 [Neurospora crassa]
MFGMAWSALTSPWIWGLVRDVGGRQFVRSAWFIAKHKRKTKGSFFKATRGVPIVLIVTKGQKGYEVFLHFRHAIGTMAQNPYFLYQYRDLYATEVKFLLHTWCHDKSPYYISDTVSFQDLDTKSSAGKHTHRTEDDHAFSNRTALTHIAALRVHHAHHRGALSLAPSRRPTHPRVLVLPPPGMVLVPFIVSQPCERRIFGIKVFREPKKKKKKKM